MMDAIAEDDTSAEHLYNDVYCEVFAGMTAKQHEVFACLAENRTSKEIAGRLQVSESAIVQRIEAVRSRTGFPPRAELARAYRRYLESGFFDCKPVSQGTEPARNDADLAAWQRQAADWILPGAMVGPNAGLNRIAAMVVIAGGLLVVALASLGVVNALPAMAERMADAHKALPALP
ncbi:LuxR family transcriptional regulator [Novosphingobium sp. 9U]|uniref:LuxR family transcriptional regulator n=1 Tax=Novosphingobium sp. 9U TaxID=2653158 RepID=UPI0012F258FF|nr:LuxR family transcriptional regulator [Novosphingobium sp. 9U]VWX52260.1 LuxR family transcriptional regulator [Novosphingobium sp. 9U]